MNRRAASIAIAAAGAAVFAALATGPALPQGAGASRCMGLGPGSTLWLDGTSNLHEFEARTSTVQVSFRCDSSGAAPATAAELESFIRSSRVKGLTVEIPVNTLHSGKNGLDKNMWQDLKADQQPSIRCDLTRIAVESRAGADTLGVRAEGTLKIAGQERPATLVARAFKGNGGLWLDGAQNLRMTDFGIKPRTMMMGTLRVHDPVVVHYHLLLVPAAGEPR